MMTVSFTMKFVLRFLLSAILLINFVLLMVCLKDRWEGAKYKKESRTLWLRHYYETHPNQIMQCSDVIAMTKEGLQEVVYVEWRNDYDDYARPNLTKNGDIQFELIGEEKSAAFKAEDYNVKFRCWLRKPTEAERRETPWEGDSHE